MPQAGTTLAILRAAPNLQPASLPLGGPFHSTALFCLPAELDVSLHGLPECLGPEDSWQAAMKRSVGAR